MICGQYLAFGRGRRVAWRSAGTAGLSRAIVGLGRRAAYVRLGGLTRPLHMRFHLGAIPSSPDFVPDASWRSLRQPPPRLANLLALPIGVAAAAVVAAFWLLVTPLRGIVPAISLPAFLLSFAGLVVVHELVHALVHPMAGRSPHSILGFAPSPASGGFYAHYDGELSRHRLVAILLMPLVIISIVPLLVSAVTQVSSGWVACVSACNAFCACADMLEACLGSSPDSSYWDCPLSELEDILERAWGSEK